MYCPNCKKEIGEDALFCPECGTKTISQKICSKCGSPLSEEMAFCAECGTPVEKQQPRQEQEPQRQAYQQPHQEQEPQRQPWQEQEPQFQQPRQEPQSRQAQNQQRQQYQSQGQQYRQPVPQPQKKFPVAAVVGICAGLVVIGIAAALLLRHPSSEDEEVNVQTVQVLDEEETNGKEAEKEDVTEIIPEEDEKEESDKTKSDKVVSVIGGSEEEEEKKEEPKAEEPKNFVGAKDKTAQQEVVTAGGQLDLVHMGNLLANAGATYGTYVLDITNQQEYDGGNAEEPLPASALIGVPILFTIADGVDKGEINLDTPVTFNYTFANGRGIFKSGDNGRTFPVSQMLSEALLNSDNNALNSLMDFLTLDRINNTCHSYGFNSVDMQRKLMSGSSDLENYISAKDAAMMLNTVYQDNFAGIGKAFLEVNFKISGSDSANRGMYPACTSCSTFLNLNGITETRYNEVGLIQNGDEVFILSVFTCNGDGTRSASALTTLTSYVVSTLQAQ